MVSNLFESLVVKKSVFNVSIPILQGNQVRYVMSLGLLPDDLVALLKSQKLGPEWVTLIWDANGIILSRSRDNPRYVGASLPQNMREHDERAVVRTANLDGTDVLHATARSQISGWGVGVNIPYSLVTGQMRNSLLLWALAGLLAITIALVSGVFFARQITTPLSAASKAAAAFGRGQLFPLTGSRLKEADAFLVALKDAQQAREKLMQKLRQSRDWLQTTLASIGDGVIATDQNGRVTFLNNVARTLTGWTQEEPVGKPLEQVFVIRNAETGLEVENPVARVLREGRIVGLANHTRLLAKDGRLIPIDDSAAPIYDSGKIVGVVLVFRDVTERLKAEEHMRLAVDAAPNAMIMVGRDGRIALINSQTEKLFGYDRNELLGKSIDILVPERYRAGHEAFRASFFREPLARAMGAGRDLFGLCKDGREVPIEIGLNPIRTSQGDFVLAAIIDISERKQAEGALRAAFARAQKGEILLNAIMDYVPEGITYAEAPEVTIRMVSRYGRELIGKASEAIEGLTVEEHAEKWDIRHLDGTAARNEELPLTRAAKNGEVVLDEDWMMRDSAGREIFLLCNAGPIRDAEGNILGGIIAWRDITQRKETELSLARTQKQLTQELAGTRGLHELASRLLTLDDEPSVLREVLATALKITGADKGNIQLLHANGALQIKAQHGFSKDFLDFFRSVGKGDDAACGAAFVRSERVVVEDIEQSPIFAGTPALEILLGNDVRAVQSTPLMSRSGSLVGIISTYYATPQQPNERDLRLIDLLARQAADLIERLRGEEALRAANLELARANEDLNQFAFAASHDLQEPLRMITSYSQMLLKGYRGQLDGEAGACVEFITAGTKRMRELLADLLAYTQVSNNRQETVEPVDFNNVFQNVLENCKAAIDETKATVTSDRLPTVEGQEPHFVQLLQNLISNGLKYRDVDRLPRIHVSAERQNAIWRIAVKDNGIGIAPEYHAQIFGVFKRLHGKAIPGTGIGLAICQRVVDRYGGKIWVESRVDQGATFYFTLPAAAEKGGAAHD